MKVTKSKANIEKAKQFNRLMKRARKLAKEIVPLKAHFKTLFDAEGGLLAAGDVGIEATVHTRTTLDKDALRLRVGEDFKSFFTETTHLELDVRPLKELQKEKAAKG